MPGIKLPYTTSNKLSYLILKEQARRTLKSGKKPTMLQLERELADYCKVSRDTIQMIKRNVNQPSLPLALKIAKYFNLNVQEIFILEEEEDNE